MLGSRLMHLLVADYVASELNIDDKPSIFLGALSPDAAGKSDTHFKAETHHLYSYNRPILVSRFVEKYRDNIRDPFLLGYVTHLVMDDVWTMKTDFDGFEKRVKQDKTLYERYHQDLFLCNAKLTAWYSFGHAKRILERAHRVPHLDEVSVEEVLQYKMEALKDFDYPEALVDTPLDLFTLEELIHYVERSKVKALDLCRILT